MKTKKMTASSLALLGLLSAFFWVSPSVASEDGVNNSERKQIVRYLHKRIDLNDNGHIGPRERRHAKRVFRAADINKNGRLGPRERQIARRMLNRSDRRR